MGSPKYYLIIFNRKERKIMKNLENNVVLEGEVIDTSAIEIGTEKLLDFNTDWRISKRETAKVVIDAAVIAGSGAAVVNMAERVAEDEISNEVKVAAYASGVAIGVAAVPAVNSKLDAHWAKVDACEAHPTRVDKAKLAAKTKRVEVKKHFANKKTAKLDKKLDKLNAKRDELNK